MFSRNGKYIIAGGGSGKNQVRVFNYSDGQLVACIYDISSSVLNIDLQYGDKYFAFGTADGEVKIGCINDKK